MSAYQLLNPDIVNSLNLYCYSATIGAGGMNTSGTVIAPLFEGTTGIFQQYSGMTGDAQYFSVGTLYIAGGVTGPGAAFHTYTQVISDPVATITFSGFFAGGNKINISGYLQTNSGFSGGTLVLQFNGDTGSNYGYALSDTTTANPGTYISVGYVPYAEGETAFGVIDIDIPRYSQNVSSKGLVSSNGFGGSPSSGPFYQITGSGNWFSTDPITSITIYVFEGYNFAAGSNLTMQIS